MLSCCVTFVACISMLLTDAASKTALPLCLLQIYIMITEKGLRLFRWFPPSSHENIHWLQRHRMHSAVTDSIFHLYSIIVFSYSQLDNYKPPAKSKISSKMFVFVQFPLYFCILQHCVSIVYISACEPSCFCILLHCRI